MRILNGAAFQLVMGCTLWRCCAAPFDVIHKTHFEPQLLAEVWRKVDNKISYSVVGRGGGSAFTFICIYLMFNLLSGPKFLFLQRLLGIFFFCAAFSSGLGTMCSLSVRIISKWQGGLLCGFIQP